MIMPSRIKAPAGHKGGKDCDRSKSRSCSKSKSKSWSRKRKHGGC